MSGKSRPDNRGRNGLFFGRKITLRLMMSGKFVFGIMAQLFIYFRFFYCALAIFSTNPSIRAIEFSSAIPAGPSFGNMIGIRKLTPIDTRTGAAGFSILNMIICFCHDNSPRVGGSMQPLDP